VIEVGILGIEDDKEKGICGIECPLDMFKIDSFDGT